MRSALIDIRHHHRRRWFSIDFPLSIPPSLSWLIIPVSLSLSITTQTPKSIQIKAYRQNFRKGGTASLVANIRRSTTEWLHRRENLENRAREAEYLPSIFPSPVSGMNPEFFFFLSLWYTMGTFSGLVLPVPVSDTGTLANFGVTVKHRNYQARNVKDYNLLDCMRRTQHKYKGN